MARFLLVTNIFPPYIGGPAIFIDRLAHELAGRGHRVTVICTSDGLPEPGYDTARPFKVCRVDLSNRYKYEIMVRLKLAWLLLRHKLVLVNGMENYVGRIAGLLRRHYILKIVGDSVWEQGRNWGMVTARFDEFQAQPTPAKLSGVKAARDRCLALADVVVTPGAWLGKVVAGWGVPESRIQVIRNGVPLSMLPAGEPVARQACDLGVLFIGRLTNWKGAETLLLAVAGQSGLRLTIIGDGPELPLINNLIVQMGLQEQVTLAGKMEQSKLHGRMAAAHVLVLPSDYEGLSHTLLEAGASGLARIASDIGGNQDAIRHEEDGLLFPYGDVAALRAALLRLRDDEDLRLRLAQAAREAARRDNFTGTVDAYVKLLEERAK